MKRVLLSALLAVCGFVAGVTAQPVQFFTMLTSHEVTAASPCGGFGWYAWHTEQVTPFVKDGDIWIMTRCTDGRLFMNRFPSMTAPPPPIEVR